MSMIALAHYPILEWVFDKVGGALAQHRRRAALREMEALGYEMSVIAKDLGLTNAQLRTLAVQEPGAPKQLKAMLRALEIDQNFDAADPSLTRDMQSLCSICSSKRRCGRELRAGTATQTFHAFCPNATNLAALRDGDAQAHPIKLGEFCPNPNIFP